MKKVPTATCALRDRWMVSIEWVYTPGTFFFFMKSAVSDMWVFMTPPPLFLKKKLLTKLKRKDKEDV